MTLAAAWSPAMALAMTLAATTAGGARAQDACAPAAFANTCTGAVLQFCSTTDPAGNPRPSPVTASFDCTAPDANGQPRAPNASCGPVDCQDQSGDGCAVFRLDEPGCLGGTGDPCIGAGPLFDGNTANDASFAALLCADPTEACVADGQGETCQPGFQACADVGAECFGNVLVLCIAGASEDTDGDGAIDANEVDLDGDGVIDSALLVPPTAIDCSTGFGTAGTCDAAATAGPLHEITGLQGQALADCNLPQETTGEGEGEGQAPGGTQPSAPACGAGLAAGLGPAGPRSGLGPAGPVAALALVLVLARRRPRRG